ncbi:MAG: 2-C-methyl-D-erythritol 4-phosphate cytidylyltransferase [Clostridia bacterium]|nr:2-C-methyl-D-erythritol 4-phosphate cytidylyltransferase [Clostridia bacterium]
MTAGSKKTAAVILAAGSSERLGGDTRKQFVKICGIPVVAHTLMAFESSSSIDEIVIVAHKDEIGLYKDLREQYKITKLRKAVIGESTRQESSLKGFEAVSEEAEFIAVADAARCLVTPEIIDAVCKASYRYGAATAAWQSPDSVKTGRKMRGVPVIEADLDRNTVWMTQTPQVFRKDIYACAAYAAKEYGFSATDDCSMVQHIGRTVYLVDCGPENIKITTQDDLRRAELILQNRRQP